jgi:hypothetical protein
MMPFIKHSRFLLQDVLLFIEIASMLKLREYQKAVAASIADSVRRRRGLTFVVMFPRQSGKNELQAQIEAYLLCLMSNMGAEIVKVSPTWKPQSQNAMRRLESVLRKNILTRSVWKKESGYIYRIKTARVIFLSGAPEANIVGATASTLLEIDEAQDVRLSKFDKDIGPMAASTNATRVFWGTAWTSRTLLARELRAAREAEKEDSRRRVFILTADEVALEVPAYKKYVAEQVARLGRNHPMIKTQYFSEEIDAEGGMFPRERMAMMQGCHPPLESPKGEFFYALLIDLAGEDEGASDHSDAGIGDGIEELVNPKRDLTALTVVECDLSTLDDDLIHAPTYRAVKRYQWVGRKHSEMYGALRGIIDHWKARFVVVDSTGVGAGLASFLDKAYDERVIPFVFSSASKSKLGWDFLGICDTGRWKEWAGSEQMRQVPSLQDEFWRQCKNCDYSVLDGPGKLMRWGVPDGTRDTRTGDLVHDC